MASLLRPRLGSNRKLTVMFITLTLLVGLPVLIFIVLAVQGFVQGVGNDKPVDVVASQISKSSAVISWHTDKKTQGVVEYGTTPTALNSYAPEVESAKEHEISLTLLSQSTTYYFQIRINGSVYDNSGIPWTFTTKNKDGEDVAEAIKGISTRIARESEEATEEAGISTNNCNVTDCNEIKAKLGKGCSSADYFKCISNSGSTQVTPGTQSYTTPIPTPTVVLIVSNLCKLDYMQLEGGCDSWSWDSFATKPQTCRDAFDRYVLQCKNTSFTESQDKQIVWYYNNAITDIASNSATFKVKPPKGERIYCQVRVEDAVGGETHSTPWVRAAEYCD